MQTLRWAFRPLPFMEECRREFGDAFGVRFLGFERPMVLISDPAAIKALYMERSHGLPPGRNIILEPILGPRSNPARTRRAYEDGWESTRRSPRTRLKRAAPRP